MPKILTIYSSARADGNTFQLVDLFNQLLPSETCYLDSLKLAQYDYQFRNQDDDFIRIIDKMLSVDVIILASPVYWYSMTPSLRKLFDRFTDLTELPHLKAKGKQLREKVFYLFATSVHAEPPKSFTSPVEDTMRYFGWTFSGTLHVECRDAFHPEDALPALRNLVSELTGERRMVTRNRQQGYAQLMSQFK